MNGTYNMRVLFKAKDGGPESRVTGYWLLEWKRVCSIVLLRFDRGGREVYHTHAFAAWSWVLRGRLVEKFISSTDPLYQTKTLTASFKPVFTGRERLHQVTSTASPTWVLSFRGPWRNYWIEWDPETQVLTRLSHGRIPQK